MNEVPDIWLKEIERLKRRKKQLVSQENLIVFYGSSSIRLWVRMKEDLSPYNVLNLGFGGSSFKWCLHFFDKLFEGLSPRKLVLYAGENDLNDGATSVEEVKDHYEKLLHKVRRTYPTAEYAQISLKPSPTRAAFLSDLLELNAYFQATMEADPKGSYIDIYHDMLTSSEETRPELFLSDGLHMNQNGYKIWSEKVMMHLLKESA